jgi:hypothetical protein
MEDLIQEPGQNQTISNFIDTLQELYNIGNEAKSILDEIRNLWVEVNETSPNNIYSSHNASYDILLEKLQFSKTRYLKNYTKLQAYIVVLKSSNLGSETLRNYTRPLRAIEFIFNSFPDTDSLVGNELPAIRAGFEDYHIPTNVLNWDMRLEPLDVENIKPNQI